MAALPEPGHNPLPGQRVANSGRKPGKPNRSTVLMREGVKSAIETLRNGGLTPIEIMAETSRILHAVARLKAVKGATPETMLQNLADLPQEQLAFIAKLFVDASDIAAKAASYAFPKLAQVDYVGDVPSGPTTQVDNRVVVVLKIGEGGPAHQAAGNGAPPHVLIDDDERRELLRGNGDDR